MKITIKPLKGSPFEVDLDLNETVLQAKTKIFNLKGGDYVQTSQKLIYQGKIMVDEKQLSEYNVKEGGFIVCMVTKPKAAPAPAPAPAAAPPVPTPAAAPAPTPSAPSTTQSAAPSVATSSENPQFTASLSQLTDMGFPEAECRAALQAAYGDANRAVEFLMNGIPAEATSAPASSAPSTAQAPSAPTTTGQSADPLAGLRALPQFDSLRRLVQSNPAALSQVLQQIGQGNPDLLAAIDQNREEFVRIMNEPVEETDNTDSSGVGNVPLNMGGNGQSAQFAAVLQAMQQMPADQRAQLAQAMGVPPEQLQAITQLMQSMPPEAMEQMMNQMMPAGGAGGAGGGGDSFGGTTITLTEEENAAVERLAELGFPKHICVEAYLACDKDEQMAANYLFSQSDLMDES